MRILLSTTTILLLVFLATLDSGFSSCTKDNTIYDTVTVIEKDTTVLNDVFFTSEMLTAHSWKYLEVRSVQGGSIIYYLRGGSSNTQSFDDAYITFHSDNTGLLTDQAGASHNITNWSFANPEHTKLTFTGYNETIASEYTWDRIRYRNDTLYYIQYFTDNSIHVNDHGQQIMIPK